MIRRLCKYSLCILTAALLFQFGTSLALAAVQPATVVSAASYYSTLAPGSFASAFGTNFVSARVQAALDAKGNYPLSLGGVTVQIGGKTAELFRPAMFWCRLRRLQENSMLL